MREAIANKRLLKILSSLALAVIICITLLAVTSELLPGSRWLELASHFKVQYLALGCLAFGTILATYRRRLSIIISLFCLLIILIDILTWYIPPRFVQNISPDHVQAQVQTQIDGSTHLKIINANIFVLNRNHDKTISFIRQENPDIAIFIEAYKTWAEKLAVLKDILPYTTELSTEYNLDIVIFSRLPLEKVTLTNFGSDKPPSKFKRASLIADLNIGGQTVTLIATHPPTPIRPIVFTSRNQILENISEYIRTLNHPVILAGDLNITMWSPYYRKLIANSGLRNARQGFGILPTWPTDKAQNKFVGRISGLVAIPIDHCLVSHEIAVQNIRTGPNVDSDHLPLITDVSIPTKIEHREVISDRQHNF
jgi:endonuclease/exonuclease/phosphatase (EEP) superfamily protein YafD